jgi:hypothetical protein
MAEAGGVVQVRKYLPSKCEALCSSLSTAKKNQNGGEVSKEERSNGNIMEEVKMFKELP